jgi:glyoxylase I family protein
MRKATWRCIARGIFSNASVAAEAIIVAIEVLGVEHIDLTVNDVARSRAFYDKVLGELGFRLLDEDEDVRWGNAQMTLAIRPAADSQRAVSFDRYRVGLHHLALKVRARADVDAFHDFLTSEKIEVLDAPAEYPQYGPNYYAVFLADPDGVKLEVVHFPWGYWRRVQTEGHDPRPRYSAKKKQGT